MYKTRLVKVGPYTLGSGQPVRVQSMCNTDTRDAAATAAQINMLENAGCEINRVAVPDMQAALALGEIKKRIHSPLVADIHFDYKLALEAVRQGVDKVRINPGNIGSIENTKEVVKACADKGVAIRIGVNAGSVKYLKSVAGQVDLSDDKWAEVMVQEALEQANVLEQLNFKNVVVSLKSDDFNRTVKANELFASQSDIPLHIGLTEAGSFLSGTVKSAIALGTLLQKSIGATIRVSLTEDPAKSFAFAPVRAEFDFLPDLWPHAGKCGRHGARVGKTHLFRQRTAAQSHGAENSRYGLRGQRPGGSARCRFRHSRRQRRRAVL